MTKNDATPEAMRLIIEQLMIDARKTADAAALALSDLDRGSPLGAAGSLIAADHHVKSIELLHGAALVLARGIQTQTTIR